MDDNRSQPFRILLAEDEDLLRWAIEKFFVARGFIVDSVKNGPEGMEKALENCYDLLITDLRLEEVSGLELGAAIRKKSPLAQTIIITGQGSKETVIAALRQGVWDFVEKPFDLELLLLTTEKALEKSRLERELIRLSRTDGLTGLYNQRHFYATLEVEMNRAGRQGRSLSLILVDVDNFKQFNDSQGHLAGDEILTGIAGCLNKACRRNVDMAFRYGGDEFMILLPEADETIAKLVADRICLNLIEARIELTLSIGLTELKPGADLREAIREADEAMYAAKQNGGNKTVTYQRSR